MINCARKPDRKAGQRMEDEGEDSTAEQSAGLAV